MKNLILFSFITLFSFTTHVGTRKILADKSASTLTYSMHHPMHDWQGVSKEVSCVVIYNEDTKQIDQVAASIPVASFDSGNSNRDSHALEVMEGLKYPKVTFASTKIATVGNAMNVEGNLTFHGVQKPVSFKATRTDSNNKMIIEGGFDVLLSTHKIDQPSLMGVKTDDKFNLKFKMVFGL